ncbi:condensation domain-containing protein [Streptomyces althioticus]|uniref:condensation domain-containing protein n=1 Tax=Streptomyces althioticus TaxID=83380 RepID=UPI00369038C9
MGGRRSRKIHRCGSRVPLGGCGLPARKTTGPGRGRQGNPGPGRRKARKPGPRKAGSPASRKAGEPGLGKAGEPDLGKAGEPGLGKPLVRVAGSLAALRALAAREGAGPAMVLLAVWCPLPHAWSGEEDGVLGMPFVGRDEPGTGDAVGLFPRVLPVRTALRAARPFGGRAVAPGGGVRSWRTTGRTRRGAAGPPSRK